MRLIRLELRNWCQFSQFGCDFSPGLTAVIGPNGSGKSNLFGALLWLLTGDNPNTGKLEENINQLSPNTERSNGALLFWHKGQTYKITRHLRPADKPVLAIDDVEVATGAAAVNARLAASLTDTKTLTEYVLSEQGNMFACLSRDPAKRAENLQRLFDTAIAQVCYDAMHKQLGTVQIPEIGTRIDEVQTDLTARRNRLAVIAEQAALLPTAAAAMAAKQAAEQTLAQWASNQQLVHERDRLDLSLRTVQDRIAPLQGHCDQLRADLTALRDAIAKDTDAYDAARLALQNLSRHKQFVAQRESLVQRVASLEATLTGTVAPVPPAEYVEDTHAADAAALHAELTRAQVDYEGKQQLVQTFNATGVAVCPTCKTPASQIAPLVSQYALELPQLSARMALVRDKLARIGQYRGQLSQWQAQQRQIDANLQQARGDLAALGEVAGQAVADEIGLTNMIASYQDYVAAGKDVEPQLQQVETSLTQLRAQETSLQASQRRNAALLGEMAVTEAAASQAGPIARQAQADFETLTQLNAEASATRNLIVTLEGTLAKLQADANSAAGRRAWLALGEEVKALLHRNGAPRFVAQAKLQQLQGAINELLRTFDADFRVAADEGLSFLGTFADGRKQPARRFSGGQKVVLAMSFVLAVNLLFAGDLGFVGLDEPTAYLDKKHIKALQPILERLRTWAASRGLQCLMITHEAELAPLFDSVVQL